jgi:hypothetical protein
MLVAGRRVSSDDCISMPALVKAVRSGSNTAGSQVISQVSPTFT